MKRQAAGLTRKVEKILHMSFHFALMVSVSLDARQTRISRIGCYYD